MDAANCSLACGLVSPSYINQGAAALAARRKAVKALLSNRSLPAEGWDEATIEMLLQVWFVGVFVGGGEAGLAVYPEVYLGGCVMMRPIVCLMVN